MSFRRRSSKDDEDWIMFVGRARAKMLIMYEAISGVWKVRR